MRIIIVMTPLLEVLGLTVELPTPGGWVRPVNQVSLRIAAGDSLGSSATRAAAENRHCSGAQSAAKACGCR